MYGKSVNAIMETLHDTIVSELDKVAPEQLVHVSTKQVINVAWMMPGLKRCSTKQLQLYKKSLLGNETDVNKYRQYRDLLRKIKRARIFSYFNENSMEFRNNSKKLWEMINNKFGKTHDKRNVISKLKIDGIENYNSVQIVNKSADHFGGIWRSYANKIIKSGKSIDSYLNKIVKNEKSIFAPSYYM